MQKEEKPMRIFIYQPFYTKDKDGKEKYLNTKTYKFPYFPIKKGDVFVTEKRVDEFVELTKDQQSKVRAVRYNLNDMSCNVLLENKMIEKKEEPKEGPEKGEDEPIETPAS
jgi:hypothetical protein